MNYNVQTIYFKPTNYCNVGCTHCYLTTLDRSHFKTLSKEQVIEVKNKLEGYFKDKKLEILWHGGEPLTIPLSELKGFLNVFTQSSLNTKHLLQTSLVPLFNKDQKELKQYVNLFKLYFDSYVGTSYDFHGVRRYEGSEIRYKEKLKEILLFLKDNNIYNGITITITKKLIGGGIDDLWSFIEEFNDISYNIAFERYNEYGVEDKRNSKNGLSISNLEYSLFMIELYKRYKTSNLKVKLQLFDDLEFGIQNNVGTDKWSGKCLTSNLVINPDGSINNCVDKADEESFGNIFENTIQEILMDKQRKKWIDHQHIHHKTGDCFSCEYQFICNSGCPLIKNEIKTETLECSGYYRLINYVFNEVKDGKNKL